MDGSSVAAIAVGLGAMATDGSAVGPGIPAPSIAPATTAATATTVARSHHGRSRRRRAGALGGSVGGGAGWTGVGILVVGDSGSLIER
jgi:hypothetical protein